MVPSPRSTANAESNVLYPAWSLLHGSVTWYPTGLVQSWLVMCIHRSHLGWHTFLVLGIIKQTMLCIHPYVVELSESDHAVYSSVCRRSVRK